MTENRINIKGLIGTYAFAATASALNMTSGILAYIMLTYSEKSSTDVALIMTIPAIVGTLFAFVSGNIINKIGVKKVTIFAHSMEFASGMIYLFFGNKTSLLVLYFAAAIYGFMLGGQTVILAELYKEMVPDEKRRGQFIGYGSSINSLGSVILASVGGAIAAIGDGAHWERAYLLYFVMLICIALEIAFIPNNKPVRTVNKTEDESIEKTAEKNKARSKDGLPIKVWLISIHYLFFFLFLYAFSLNISEYVITTHSLGTSAQAGLCLSALTVGGIVSGLTYGFYSKALGNWTMPALLLINTCGLAMVVFIHNMNVLLFASFILGLSMMGCSPYVTVEMSRITNEKTYTKAMSVFAGFMNGGMMFAVYILAFLAKIIFNDPNTVDGKFMIAFVGGVIVMLTSIPIYALKKK